MNIESDNLYIKGISIHQVDHSSDLPVEIDVSNQGDKLNGYIKALLHDIQTSNNKRLFSFASSTSEVKSSLDLMLNGQFKEGANIIVQRLLRIEQIAQQAINQLNVQIQRGSLLQALVEDNDNRKIIISKADHSEYLDEKDFSLRSGLPWKKRIFKAIIISFRLNNTIYEIFVYDTNSIMSKYWWHDYLELQEQYADTHNTKTSLEVLDKKIFNPIKNKYKADHTVLRNSTLGYFRNREEFEINDFIEQIFANYSPIDEELKVSDLIKKVNALPEKHKFDQRFTIEKSEIKLRMSTKIRLNESIDLILNDHISNLADLVQPWQDEQGNKYIKIRTDEGYERFGANHNSIS